MWGNLKRQALGCSLRKKKREDAGWGLSRRDKTKCILEGIAIMLLFSWFFYHSFLALPFLIPVYLMYQKERGKFLCKKRKKETAIQFKDAIMAVSVSQKAGYSVENAFKQSYSDMILLYGKESVICKEWNVIISGLKNNVPVEKLLHDFGKRSGVEDVIEFAQIFSIAKRRGGNLTEMIERSAAIIEEKAEIEKEIQVIISARHMEQKIMNMVPFGILLYVGAASKGFFHVLYKNAAGVMIMTVCLLIYLGAVYLSSKIVDIEV